MSKRTVEQMDLTESIPVPGGAVVTRQDAQPMDLGGTYGLIMRAVSDPLCDPAKLRELLAGQGERPELSEEDLMAPPAPKVKFSEEELRASLSELDYTADDRDRLKPQELRDQRDVATQADQEEGEDKQEGDEAKS